MRKTVKKWLFLVVFLHFLNDKPGFAQPRQIVVNDENVLNRMFSALYVLVLDLILFNCQLLCYFL